MRRGYHKLPYMEMQMVDLRCSARSVTVSTQNYLFNRETRVYAGIRRWKFYLSESTSCQKYTRGIWFTQYVKGSFPTT
jgi:hypothetical protein